MILRLYLPIFLVFFSTMAKAQLPDSNGVVFHEDPRLTVLFAHKQEDGFKSIRGAIYSQRGFRVQIYNGNDRNLATQRKIDFLRRFPDVPSYMSYIAPSFRVKVGNFKSRADAYDFYRQVSPLYTPCMVVPDIVVINSMRNDH
ncbi:MAG: SPOR domain-containing protein [Chitinophagaceae bacterium]